MKDSPHYRLEIVRETSKQESIFDRADLVWALDEAEFAMSEDDVVAISLSVKLKEKNGS